MTFPSPYELDPARRLGGKTPEKGEHKIIPRGGGAGAQLPTDSAPGPAPRINLNDVMPDDTVLTTINGRDWTYGEMIELGFLQPGATYNDYLQETTLKTEFAAFLEDQAGTVEDQVGFEDLLESLLGGGGSGRRGTSRAAAVYTSPDENLVNEAMRNYVVAVTGERDQQLIDGAVNVYLTTDRANFGSTTPSDPGQAAKDFVRGSAKYKDLHELRPDTVDEMDWVTDPIAKLQSAGLSAARAQALGIKQARVGADDAALQRAAEMAETTDTGRLLASQRERLKAKGRAALGLI